MSLIVRMHRFRNKKVEEGVAPFIITSSNPIKNSIFYFHNFGLSNFGVSTFLRNECFHQGVKPWFL